MIRHCEDKALLEALRDKMIELGVPKRRSYVRWTRVEKKLKVPLPEDYRWLTRHFESFYIKDCWLFFAPQASSISGDLYLFQDDSYQAYAMTRWEDYEYPEIPEHLDPSWRPPLPADRSYLGFMGVGNASCLAWEVMDGAPTNKIFFISEDGYDDIVIEAESWAHLLLEILDEKRPIPIFAHEMKDEPLIRPLLSPEECDAARDRDD